MIRSVPGRNRIDRSGAVHPVPVWTGKFIDLNFKPGVYRNPCFVVVDQREVWVCGVASVRHAPSRVTRTNEHTRVIASTVQPELKKECKIVIVLASKPKETQFATEIRIRDDAAVD